MLFWINGFSVLGGLDAIAGAVLMLLFLSGVRRILASCRLSLANVRGRIASLILIKDDFHKIVDGVVVAPWARPFILPQ